MKKSKLLMLSTIATVSSVMPLVAIVSCGTNNSDAKFVCEQTEQKTTRGEVICWYQFDLQGNKTLSQDLEVYFASDVSEKLNDNITIKPVEGSNKSILVGVEGIKDKLSDNEEVTFKLGFKSNNLKLDQSIDCKYIFLASHISPKSPKSYELDYEITTIMSVKLDFNIEFYLGWSQADFSGEVINLKKNDENINDPELVVTKVESSGEVLELGFELTKNGAFSKGDQITFDVKVKNTKNQWEQIVTGYSYTVTEIAYEADEDLDTTTMVQVDYLGTEQEALKAVDASSNGILKSGTPIGTPFRLKYLKANNPWSGEYHYLKLNSYVNPKESWIDWHKFNNVAISIIKSDDSIASLDETKSADSFGKLGFWWVSEGGPFTIINRGGLLDKSFPDWKGLIFSLRTADEIKTDTSFYLTYSNNI